MVVGILVAAVHAAVTIVVHRAIAHVQLVHHVDHAHDDLWVVGGITVNLHVEDVAATGDVVVGRLHLSLVTGRALVIHGYVVRVGVVVAVGDAGYDAELLAVLLGELAREALGRCGQHGVVVVVTLGELVHSVAHVGDNAQSQLLALLRLTVVLAREGNKAFCQSYEADAERTLVDDALHGVGGFQFVGTYPEALHEQGELLGEGRLLELESVVELLGGELEHVVELGEEEPDALLLVRLAHTLDGQLDDVDG